jgi:hypothetical protein
VTTREKAGFRISRIVVSIPVISKERSCTPKPATSGPNRGASLRLFLFFLIAVVFVLPSLGLEKNNVPLYSDIVFSLVLVFGSMIAWENRKLFVLTFSVSIAAIGVRWMA